ncbi:MAG TPA: TonB family protein [Candidatus Baltobacteraceae bacterium]|nr:TonB family protein [Candidatus Baltobacteraceae bacterium]
MKNSMHDRIEAIAGAIALGEASDQERHEYREHIATCAPCLHAYGGEREIERVISTVASARDSEVWAPQIGDVVATRLKRRARKLRWGFGTLGVAIAASLGLHALVAAGVGPIGHSSASPVVINAGITRIVLEQNAPAPTPVPVTVPQPRLIVTHNVVQIARAPVTMPVAAAPASAEKAEKPRQMISMTVHPNSPARPQLHSNVPVWRRPDTAWRTVAQTTTTSITETAPQTLTHHAESLEVSSVTRDVAPVGGESAINPQPSAIAYDEGAQGTTVFEVLVDEHGSPTRCVITKGSGYRVLDDAVCRAAKSVRYTPKMVDGRAEQGVYRDAFTFHQSDATQQSEGIPQTIPETPRTPPPSDTPQLEIPGNQHPGSGNPR